MTDMSRSAAPIPASIAAPAMQDAGIGLLRTIVIGVTAFLTVVDLFATQAILPSLVAAYGVTPAAMGVAVNASTIGMAVSGLAVALLGRRIDHKLGVLWSLGLLSIPTALLAAAPDLATFTALRIVQGLFMSAAFTLTLAYLAEHCSARATATAFAAYITGNVASNLVGRLISAAAAEHLGLDINFYLFAALNLSGAILVHFTLKHTPPKRAASAVDGAPATAWRAHLRSPSLRAAFGIGFLVLFAFIGTFTYVNFELVGRLGLSPMALGFVYLVFLPSILTTPFAGRLAARLGARPTLGLSLAVAVAGLPPLLLSSLPAVLAGLALVGIGTFFAQATATGFVGRAATADRAAASGIYLASYFSGGLAGSALLGQAYDRLGWGACVAGIFIALLLAAILAVRLRLPEGR